MTAEELIKKYLPQGTVVQLATVTDGQPWVCALYYVVNERLNIYWLSFPTRRHSREISRNSKVAVTVPIKLDKPVIGVQAEGIAEEVTDTQEIEKIMQFYISKYNSGKDFLTNFRAGKNQHIMYKFTPTNFVLFDEVNFSEDGRQEWKPQRV